MVSVLSCEESASGLGVVVVESEVPEEGLVPEESDELVLPLCVPEVDSLEVEPLPDVAPPVVAPPVVAPPVVSPPVVLP